MTATARSSTLYTNHDVNKEPADSRNRNGSMFPIYFEATIVSASNIADTYNLFVIPANWSVMLLYATSNGLGITAGVGCTGQIGDSGDDDRLMPITDFDLVNQAGHLAYAGVGYRPTADTIEILKIGTAAAIVGKLVKGHVVLLRA
jgi:hypothetical protein